MDLKSCYSGNFKKLIKKERDYEINFHRNEIKRMGEKRENTGRAILNLNGKVIKQIFNEKIVRYGRKKKFEKIDISVGDVVLISKGNPLLSDFYGNVIAIGGNHIDVSVESVPKWAVKDVRIDLYVNDVTFKRMTKALEKFEVTRNKIANIIIGIEKPKYCAINEKTLKYLEINANIDLSSTSTLELDEIIKNFDYCDNSLNFYQKEAVIRALLANDLYMVHGPPGTGKTRTITELIIQETKRGNSVIATADSNTAVDNILENLSKAPKIAKKSKIKYETKYGKYDSKQNPKFENPQNGKLEKLKIVRIGHPSRISKELIDYSLHSKITKHELYIKIVKLRELLEREYLKRKEIPSPDPKYRRGLTNDDIILYDKLKQHIRGIPPKKLEEMALWVRCNEKIAKIKDKIAKTEKQIITDIIENSDVVLATNSMAGSEYLEDFNFNVGVIDECSQSMEPSTLITALKCDKIVMAGDHKQLPPTVLSDEIELKNTLFERMIKENKEFSQILKIQYRMNDKIMGFSNKLFYENQLISDESVKNRVLSDLDYKLDSELDGELKSHVGIGTDISTDVDSEIDAKINNSLFNDNPLVLINTEGNEKRDDFKSYYNKSELKIIDKIINKYLKNGLAISVISPYDAQVKKIKEIVSRYETSENELNEANESNETDNQTNALKIKVKSIDGYQGREDEIIVVSFVRSEKIGFLSDLRRLNVALTRAKRKLILVGNFDFLTSNSTYLELYDYMIEKNADIINIR
ncbi:superfamily I DNA and/or RNA helicase [Methanococcus voltae]|uniref:AAA domain-containing protein n=1 Tax=Methanococcus voltae TaxID=2188 RepID=UPI001AE6B7E4|nr:AAA domain-containing protein [Methanococcus voltae]MBP2143108.1 superfamily I DNA and/or RNA helicase [Methanococcus voltae]